MERLSIAGLRARGDIRKEELIEAILASFIFIAVFWLMIWLFGAPTIGSIAVMAVNVKLFALLVYFLVSYTVALLLIKQVKERRFTLLEGAEWWGAIGRGFLAAIIVPSLIWIFNFGGVTLTVINPVLLFFGALIASMIAEFSIDVIFAGLD